MNAHEHAHGNLSRGMEDSHRTPKLASEPASMHDEMVSNTPDGGLQLVQEVCVSCIRRVSPCPQHLVVCAFHEPLLKLGCLCHVWALLHLRIARDPADSRTARDEHSCMS